ncbi:MAG: hypothetical protein IKP42_02715 [Ruminococcus sp.]|nr:hypothetical protein [Ruminococcus sp.]
MSNKLILTAVMFVIAFMVVTFIFIKRPDIAKSKNRTVRAAVIFCIAFVPGVLAATVCAKTLTEICSHIRGETESIVLSEDIDDDEEEEDDEEEKHSAV